MLLEIQRLKWEQRVREDYIKWEDLNSKYFHSLVVNRRQHNEILHVMNVEGHTIEDQAKIGETVTHYFALLF